MDVVSKVILIVITNQLQLVLNKIGTLIQFCSTLETGCPDGSFSIKTLLRIKKETDKSTLVVFVDLIKVFDSINHKILFKILEKFGIPNRVIMVIKNLYKYFKIKLTVGKFVNLVDYSTGVEQSDNLAHTLFIIVKQWSDDGETYEEVHYYVYLDK